MTCDPNCTPCRGGPCCHGEQSEDADSLELFALRAEVAELRRVVEELADRNGIAMQSAAINPAAQLKAAEAEVASLRVALEQAEAKTVAMESHRTQLEAALFRATAAPIGASLYDLRARFEAEYLEAALERNGGRIVATAADVGISRTSLWERLKRHGINAAAIRARSTKGGKT